jgi:hypothetical protein
LATLHLRCLGLIDRPCVRGKWRTVWMDNLFTSLRFAYYAHTLTGCHIAGLCRPNRGVPNCVWQATEKNAKKAALLKGTCKKASLVNGTFGVFIASVYDNKPVHIMVQHVSWRGAKSHMHQQRTRHSTPPPPRQHNSLRQSTAVTDSDWVMKERRWFSGQVESRRPYRRLALIDMYNHNMDGVDLQDQLRWYYRFDGKRMWRSQVPSHLAP